jgi:pyrimidine-nucleoside phosphorylase
MVDDPSKLRLAPELAVTASRSGGVHAIDAYAVGELLVRMGGGRAKKDDKIDPSVGMRLLKKVGDPVAAGEPLAMIYGSSGSAAAELATAYRLDDAPVAAAPLVFERLA